MIYETLGQFGVVFGGKEGPVTPGERTSEQSGVHFGVTLGSLWAYRRRLASMMHICSGLVGPKSGNVEKVLVSKSIFRASKKARLPQPNERLSGPDRLGGGRGRVNPPPRRLVWRFWEVWRVCCLVTASTRLEARGLGGLTPPARPAGEKCGSTPFHGRTCGQPAGRAGGRAGDRPGEWAPLRSKTGFAGKQPWTIGPTLFALGVPKSIVQWKRNQGFGAKRGL